MKKTFSAIISFTLVISALCIMLFQNAGVNAASTKNRALKAYKTFLSGESSKYKFTIAYIDNNSTPELIVDRKPYGSRLIGYGDLYTYKNGKVKLVDSHLEIIGKYFKHYKKTGVYIDDDSYQGARVTAYYKLKGSKTSVKASKTVYDPSVTDLGTEYSVNNKNVSKAKFKSFINKLTDYKTAKKAKLYKNSSSNRNKYL